MTCCGTGTYNHCIKQGATYTKDFTWLAGTCSAVGAQPSPVDLTGYSAGMQIRAYPLATPVLYDASSNLVLGGTAGTITLTIPAANTESFTWWNGVYDLILTSSSAVITRLLQGTVSVSAGVTP